MTTLEHVKSIGRPDIAPGPAATFGTGWLATTAALGRLVRRLSPRRRRGEDRFPELLGASDAEVMRLAQSRRPRAMDAHWEYRLITSGGRRFP